jgi:hypothetical protein
MSFLAVAHETAADQIGSMMDATERLGHYMIQGGAAV